MNNRKFDIEVPVIEKIKQSQQKITEGDSDNTFNERRDNTKSRMNLENRIKFPILVYIKIFFDLLERKISLIVT